MKELKFRKLRADEIDVRVGTVSEKGSTWLLYKDARVDMSLLDEVVGWNNWQREHKEIKGNCYCGVSIWDEDKKQWITKWDAGKESQTEAEKGEASDSFKRACVNATGVGRELYTAPIIFISTSVLPVYEKQGKYVLADKFAKPIVSSISYDESGAIKTLELKYKNNVIFAYGTNTKVAENTQKPTFSTNANEINKPITDEDKKFITDYMNTLTIDKLNAFVLRLEQVYKVKSVGELNAQQGKELKTRLLRNGK